MYTRINSMYNHILFDSKGRHDKYLHAEDNEKSINQDRNGSSKNAKWTVEHIPEYDNIIRLKSCYNKYLTASNQPLLLGVMGQKVIQTLPRRLDSSVEWEGAQVKLKTRYGNILRGNGGLPPWRNSVTLEIHHRSATQDWILWDVDVLEIHVGNPPPPPLEIHHRSATQDWILWDVDVLEIHVGNPPPPPPVTPRLPNLKISHITTYKSDYFQRQRNVTLLFIKS
ncbi:DUF569 family protein [Medicago truncatula]|uniref:DUF569 family protein n=1 Tax=Medicago truncatula TaxID=3880 RepID=A0A072TRG5_MEDTR|nr:DUF569 family protein [Medicago truncatula]